MAAVMFHSGWGAGSWLVMGFMMLLFWTLVIGGIIWVVRGANHPHQSPQQLVPNSARQILDERFARGEIGEDEYRQRRSLLS
jgi:putative membrane protein